MRCLAFITVVLIFIQPSPSWAIDASSKVRRDRPANLDVSKVKNSVGGFVRVAYEPVTGSVPLNTIHSWILVVKDRQGQPVSGAEINVSGDMPEHLHGMTTRPVVRAAQASGEYLVDGMNFHMPGYWEVTLDITGEGSRDLVRFHLLVGESIPSKSQEGTMQ